MSYSRLDNRQFREVLGYSDPTVAPHGHMSLNVACQAPQWDLRSFGLLCSVESEKTTDAIYTAAEGWSHASPTMFNVCNFTYKQTTKMTTMWLDRSGGTKLVKGNLKKVIKMLNPFSKNGKSVSTSQNAPAYCFPNGSISPHWRLFIHTNEVDNSDKTPGGHALP
jgi:hypothetical protein